MGVNMTLHPASHITPSNRSALSPKALKTEACVSACGKVIPRWDVSIFSLLMDVIRLTLNSMDVVPCVVGCLSVHAKFGPI